MGLNEMTSSVPNNQLAKIMGNLAENLPGQTIKKVQLC